MEREQHLFRGSSLNAVDAKGRLSVPGFIRQKIELRAGDKTVVLGPHAKFPCLVGYDTKYSDKMQDKADKKLGDNPDDAAELDVQTSMFGDTLDVGYDGSGRVIVPPRYRKRAGIEDLALFVGLGGEFQIWNPQSALESESPALRKLAADLLEEREAA